MSEPGVNLLEKIKDEVKNQVALLVKIFELYSIRFSHL